MEGKEKGWMIATIVLAVLLVGAVVAIVILAINQGDEGDILAVEEQVEQLEAEKSTLEAELAAAEADAAEAAQAPAQLTDEELLTVLGESLISDPNMFTLGQIMIEGDWARVSLAPVDPTTTQGDSCYYNKRGGYWRFEGCGTGLTPEDLPGAPESIFP
jgi:hypothetical protein